MDSSQVKNINRQEFKVLINSLLEWKKQKIKRDNHEISYEEYLNWKLNYLKDIYDLDVLKNTSISESKNNSNDFYLATIIINNGDIKKYRKRIRSCGLERVKKLKSDIIVDLYI